MKSKAFSLIELIFVIVIIGILAAVAIPKIEEARTGAKSEPTKTIQSNKGTSTWDQ